ncbi:MAG: NifB/NifX family molybdenum-iron cluster-binding protein [Desulfurivibrionaceae bacterium]
MDKKRIAVPSSRPGGLDGNRSQHFGHCDMFTLVDIDQGKISAVGILNNENNGAGSCTGPVQLLRQNGVDAVVVAGIGARPLQGCEDAGIAVYFAAEQAYLRVEDVVSDFTANRLARMDPTQACQGHGKCHGHSHGCGLSH